MYRGSARDKDGGEGRKFEWLLSSEGEAEKGSFYATASIWFPIADETEME